MIIRLTLIISSMLRSRKKVFFKRNTCTSISKVFTPKLRPLKKGDMEFTMAVVPLPNFTPEDFNRLIDR